MEGSKKNSVAGQWTLREKLGSGTFGDIYIGSDVKSGESVAIKLECKYARFPQLQVETALLRHLGCAPDGNNGNSVVGFPQLLWFGEEGIFRVLVMQLLGPSLAELLKFCGGKFSLKTTLMLADQLLSRMQHVHSKSFVHRDIKPENFLMGVGRAVNIVHAIDFGISQKYQDLKSKLHIPHHEKGRLVGTARYASINVHMGAEYSRRDDLESLGYLLLHFVRGSLPWQGLRAASRSQKYEEICSLKITTKIDELCKDVPAEFAAYLRYCRNLKFDEDPDYDHLRGLFRSCYDRQGYANNEHYDWTLVKQTEST